MGVSIATTRPQASQLSAVGQLLRDWRNSRGISQLELAMHAGFSARHVSFIETGRSQPSRHALLVLADSLDMPLGERNRLLEAAGYAHVYRQTPLAAEEMTQVRSVLQFIIDRHHPYPAAVLDRYTNCLMANDQCLRLVAMLVDPSLLAEPVNFLRATFHPLGARRWIVNWNEFSWHLLMRTERELERGFADPRGAALLDELRGYDAQHSREKYGSAGDDLLVPMHVRKQGVDMRLFCTFLTLGTPQDVTLQELRIETFFPADAASERAWTQAAALQTVATAETVRSTLSQ